MFYIIYITIFIYDLYLFIYHTKEERKKNKTISETQNFIKEVIWVIKNRWGEMHVPFEYKFA